MMLIKMAYDIIILILYRNKRKMNDKKLRTNIKDREHIVKLVIFWKKDQKLFVIQGRINICKNIQYEILNLFHNDEI